MRWILPLAALATLSCLTSGCKPSETSDRQPDQVPPVSAAETSQQPGKDGNSQPQATEATTPVDAPPPQQQRPVITDDEGNQIPVTMGAAPGYVPDGACKDCHADLFDSFQQMGMARSVYQPSAENIVEDYEDNLFYHELSDRHYEMTHRDGVFYQKRYQLTEGGARVNELEARVDLVIGSGNHVRTYVTRNAAGELFQLPVSWYAQNGNWGMSPGYDVPNNPGFTRLIKRECMFCHNAYPAQPAGTDFLGQPFAYPAQLPHGIGCQRCHGPGAEHVRVAYTPAAGIRKTRESIVNPSKLEPKLRDDVCHQCHLQPTSNPTSFMRLVGRGDYSYVPGEPIEDYMLIVDYKSMQGKAGRFEVNHHAYRLYQSPCYVNSEGAMSCLTCHDPHRKPTADERTAHFRSRCLSCHQLDQCRIAAMADADAPDHLETTDCVPCHMPKHRTEDVIQVLATDHLIRRDPAPEEWLAPRRERGRAVPPPPIAESPQRTPDEETFALHVALFAGVQKKVQRLPMLRSSIEEAEPDGAQAYLYQAKLEEVANKFNDAEKTYRKIIEKYPHILGGYTGLAHALQRQGRAEEAIEPARYAVTANPLSADAYHVLGTGFLSLGRINEAGPVLQRAIQLRPYHVSARSNLAQAFASIGDLASAAKEYEAILAVNPIEASAYVDLAPVLVYLNRSSDAVDRLRHGTSLLPGLSSLQETLAMLLVITDQFDDALIACTRARKLGAADTTCALVEALANHGKGELTKAPPTFRLTLDKGRPDNSQGVLYDLLLKRARSTFDR